MIDLYGISNILAAITSSSMAILVYIKGGGSKANRIWSIFALCVAIYGFGAYTASTAKNSDSAFRWWQFSYVGVIMLPALFLHFIYSFLNIKRAAFLRIIYSVTFLILLSDIFSKKLFVGNVSLLFSNSTIFKPAYWIYPPGPLHIFFTLVFYLLLVLWGHIELIKGYKRSQDLKRHQIKYFFLATALGFLGGGTSFLPCFGINLYPIFNSTVMLYPIIMTYAILKYRLMDIRVALTRAGIFIAVYTLVLGIPFALALWGKAWLMAMLGYYWWMSPLVLLGSLAVAGPYLYIYIDRRAEERLFRDLKAEQTILKNYKKDLEGAAKTMILVHDPGMLIKMIVRTIVQKAKVTHAGILLYNKDKDTYSLTVSRGTAGVKIPEGFLRLDANNPLIRLFKERKDKEILAEGSLIYEEAKKSLKDIKPDDRKLLEDALYQMEILETNICIPSYFRDDLLGILLLGRKEGGAVFKREEVDLFIALASDVAMAIRNAQLFKELEIELTKKQRLFIHTTIALAAAIDAKDHYTHGHTARVTALSLELAKKLSAQNKKILDEKFLESLHIAGLLHDIGKIGISESILNKDGPLDEKETQIMQSHPLVGTTILQPIKELEDAIIGVKYHHERYDGSGYPEGLKQDQIPLIASIISVADTFDAMITDRPYRRGLSKEEAIKEIRDMAGKQFNPWIASAFVELYQEGKI